MREAPYRDGLNWFEISSPCPVLTRPYQNKLVLAKRNNMITIDMLMFLILGIGLGHYVPRIYDVLFGPKKYTAKEWFEEENIP